jgi:hypothetical protein
MKSHGVLHTEFSNRSGIPAFAAPHDPDKGSGALMWTDDANIAPRFAINPLPHTSLFGAHPNEAELFSTSLKQLAPFRIYNILEKVFIVSFRVVFFVLHSLPRSLKFPENSRKERRIGEKEVDLRLQSRRVKSDFRSSQVR